MEECLELLLGEVGVFFLNLGFPVGDVVFAKNKLNSRLRAQSKSTKAVGGRLQLLVREPPTLLREQAPEFPGEALKELCRRIWKLQYDRLRIRSQKISNDKSAALFQLPHLIGHGPSGLFHFVVVEACHMMEHGGVEDHV